MKHKAFYYMNSENNNQETYGLKTLNCPHPKSQRNGAVGKRLMKPGK